MIKNEDIVREYYQNHLTLFDDILFREAAENKDFVEELLQVLLKDKGLKVIESTAQKEFVILNQRGVILDCYCRLSDGRLVNIEVERNDEKDKCDHQRRVRYYGSMIDVKNLKKSDDFKDLPDVYMIYLTSKDIFRQSKTTYYVDRTLRDSKMILDNGYHEIYINAEVNDNTDISEVMKIMSTKDYINENFKTISEVKEDKTMPVEVERALEGLKNECRAEGMAKGKAEGMAKGKAEGMAKGKAEMLMRLLNQKLISEEVVMNNLNIDKNTLSKMMKEYA